VFPPPPVQIARLLITQNYYPAVSDLIFEYILGIRVEPL